MPKIDRLFKGPTTYILYNALDGASICISRATGGEAKLCTIFEKNVRE